VKLGAIPDRLLADLDRVDALDPEAPVEAGPPLLS
jgi:hypothetical protein